MDQLLGWHGQGDSGVRVPFQGKTRDDVGVIETDLIKRLGRLADGIAGGAEVPRIVLLVGGPGNGKSETVHHFLEALGAALNDGGALVSRLQDAFAPDPLVPRKVRISPEHLPTSARGSFAATVGELQIVQDATATERADGDAAEELVDEIENVLTSPGASLLVACANRGLLARALRIARQNDNTDIASFFRAALRATSVGLDVKDRPSCWPLDWSASGSSLPQVACWPLDLDSLVSGPESTASQLIATAVVEAEWDVAERCGTCEARAVCPFRQNASWLRDDATRAHLLTVLRHGELAVGQRWNFRDLFSLVAELVVGQQSDFADSGSACEWVHERVADVQSDSPPQRAVAAADLAARLYPHALFVADVALGEMAEHEGSPFAEARSGDFPPADYPVSDALARWSRSRHGTASTKHVRSLLRSHYSPLDPALSSPRDTSSILVALENEFSQSTAQGLSATEDLGLGIAEATLLAAYAAAEAEWDELSNRSADATLAARCFRRAASAIAKRSAGARGGLHADLAELDAYEATIQDAGRLRQLIQPLHEILGGSDFQFDLLESFGQAREPSQGTAVLTGSQPSIRPRPAPIGDDERPGHDVPVLVVDKGAAVIPLTYDFFRALRLRARGCASASLPASVRAAIDRLRHSYAGRLSHDADQLADGTAHLILGGAFEVVSQGDGSDPHLSSRQ